MADIKTKESVKKAQGGPRKLDRSLMLADKLKDTTVRAGDYAKDMADDGEVTPDEYAENRIKYAVDDVADRTRRNIKKNINRAARTVKNTRRSVQNTGNAVKTAEKTTKTTVKTAEATAKAAQKAAEASAKASRKAVEATRQAGIAAYKAAVAVGKAIVAACKAIAAGISKLVAAIGAGGAVAVIVIIVLCLIGVILASCFGLFASNEKSSTNNSAQTMREVILEINQEYQDKLDSIIDTTYHEKIEMSGSRAAWSEVLTIYAVKTNTDQNSPQDVATINNEKKQLLKDIFWEMNSISYKAKTVENVDIIETVDENGKIKKEEKKSLVTVLYITIIHKTTEEMCSTYGFNDSQKSLVKEMLAMDSTIWDNLLEDMPYD